jgi:predicted O-methyltransferase YrrM
MITDKKTPITSFIDEVIAKVPGWTPPDQLLCLFNLVCASSHIPGDILEIGSWCGRSTVVMAQALQVCGNGRIQSIDLFPARDDWRQNKDGSWSFRTNNTDAYTVQTVWDEPFQNDIAPLYKQHESILDIFLSSLRFFNLEHLVDYHKGNWESFAPDAVHRLFRLAFLDADHSVEAVTNDIVFALRHMPNGGWLCFDDAFSSYDGVNQAIEQRVWTNARVSFAHQLCRKFHIAHVLPACSLSSVEGKV